MTNMVEVHVVGLIMDPVSKSPVMILEPLHEKKIIPIWIGLFEANAIALELEKVISPRPLTHDLMKSIMTHLDAHIDKVVITDLVENTYYAEIYLEREKETCIIDCRPSDAVAIALKNKARIFVTEQVMEASIVTDILSNLIQGEERLDTWFESLSPEDFGKYEQ